MQYNSKRVPTHTNQSVTFGHDMYFDIVNEPSIHEYTEIKGGEHAFTKQLDKVSQIYDILQQVSQDHYIAFFDQLTFNNLLNFLFPAYEKSKQSI